MNGPAARVGRRLLHGLRGELGAAVSHVLSGLSPDPVKVST
jgi:hypothetical protein